MRFLFKLFLRIVTRTILAKYNPIVVGITGSVGKSSAKEAIYAVLRKKFSVQRSEGNLNNEIGVPLAILGVPYDEYSTASPLGLGLTILGRSSKLLFSRKSFAQILVLELALDRPEDIWKLVRMVKPQVGVITAVGEIPVHVEFFSGPSELAQEKGKLVEALPQDGVAILNCDDDIVSAMRQKTKARVITYGFGRDADMRIDAFQTKIQPSEFVGSILKLSYQNTFIPVRLAGILGKPHAYAVACAAAVGVMLNINLVEIAQALAAYQPLSGRLNLLSGIKQSLILDDTYNASPSAMHEALDILFEFADRRKVAVLGDMLELGEYSEDAHRNIGNLAPERIDVLVCVGGRARFIADSAKNQMPQNSIYCFDTSEQAKKPVQELIRENDVILVKGSQGMRMEKIVEEIMAEPQRAEELLVRQSKKWKKR